MRPEAVSYYACWACLGRLAAYEELPPVRIARTVRHLVTIAKQFSRERQSARRLGQSANSILNRLQKLLIYLAKNDPNGGWAEFVYKASQSGVTLSLQVNSQGSGHAAYIGKLFRVKKVLMFSGSQDYMNDLNWPPPWQACKSATPPSPFFAFLNPKDPFDLHHQIETCMVLIGDVTHSYTHGQTGPDYQG